MKKLLLAIAVLISFSAFSQKEKIDLPIDPETKRISYTEVVKIDSLTLKHELFLRAKEWFAKTYNSANDVIQFEDKESGKIVGKALMQVYYKAMGMTSPSGYINYTVTIQVKDGRYKYEFTNFHHTGGVNIPSYGNCEDMINTKDKNMGFSPQRAYNLFLTQMNQNIESIINNLKSTMNIGVSKAENGSDW